MDKEGELINTEVAKVEEENRQVKAVEEKRQVKSVDRMPVKQEDQSMSFMELSKLVGSLLAPTSTDTVSH